MIRSTSSVVPPSTAPAGQTRSGKRFTPSRGRRETGVCAPRTPQRIFSYDDEFTRSSEPPRTPLSLSVVSTGEATDDITARNLAAARRTIAELQQQLQGEKEKNRLVVLQSEALPKSRPTSQHKPNQKTRKEKELEAQVHKLEVSNNHLKSQVEILRTQVEDITQQYEGLHSQHTAVQLQASRLQRELDQSTVYCKDSQLYKALRRAEVRVGELELENKQLQQQLETETTDTEGDQQEFNNDHHNSTIVVALGHTRKNTTSDVVNNNTSNKNYYKKNSTSTNKYHTALNDSNSSSEEHLLTFTPTLAQYESKPRKGLYKRNGREG
eukprot:NODE_197_length_1217_cov_280.437615_g193_i0.p1 GENE.NODE_197_length_1217_cov_280.437615_g193_i0~~NODE_197_length_1217_cov_280.437615_g193_i0.p1  ORF type:complete len:325 (+),score=66.67 NODE_197_length_1217_cov_280.437615_g193_i0:124-1098(+)